MEQNEQKTGATSASTVKNSSKTPEFQHIDSYGRKAEHSQKGENKHNFNLALSIMKLTLAHTYT